MNVSSITAMKHLSLEHGPAVELFTTRRIAIIDGDAEAAEMLHTFFRLMELDASLVKSDSTAVPTLRRLHPDVIVLDLDLPDLRSLDLARAIHEALPLVPIILTTDRNPRLEAIPWPIIAKPHGQFEELLRLFELVLALEG
jgi:CheY-like chemotaxis protein